MNGLKPYGTLIFLRFQAIFVIVDNKNINAENNIFQEKLPKKLPRASKTKKSPSHHCEGLFIMQQALSEHEVIHLTGKSFLRFFFLLSLGVIVYLFHNVRSGAPSAHLLNITVAHDLTGSRSKKMSERM